MSINSSREGSKTNGNQSAASSRFYLSALFPSLAKRQGMRLDHLLPSLDLAAPDPRRVDQATRPN
jgi:hypothetical protein